MIRVWSTPRVPENHARQIIRDVDRCSHVSVDFSNASEGEPDDVDE
jgi:hypothetical protein